MAITNYAIKVYTGQPVSFLVPLLSNNDNYYFCEGLINCTLPPQEVDNEHMGLCVYDINEKTNRVAVMDMILFESQDFECDTTFEFLQRMNTNPDFANDVTNKLLTRFKEGLN